MFLKLHIKVEGFLSFHQIGNFWSILTDFIIDFIGKLPDFQSFHYVIVSMNIHTNGICNNLRSSFYQLKINF